MSLRPRQDDATTGTILAAQSRQKPRISRSSRSSSCTTRYSFRSSLFRSSNRESSLRAYIFALVVRVQPSESDWRFASDLLLVKAATLGCHRYPSSWRRPSCSSSTSTRDRDLPNLNVDVCFCTAKCSTWCRLPSSSKKPPSRG